MKNTKPKAVIIGAGVGGLSLGPMLSKNGFDVHIYESNKTIGCLLYTSDAADE